MWWLWMIGIALLMGAAGMAPGFYLSVYGQTGMAGGYGVTSRVSVNSAGQAGNDDSYGATLNADGRYVAFAGNATNLVNGDTNRVIDIFVHDSTTGNTERVSVSSEGTQGLAHSEAPALSADGQLVVFQSLAGNLVPGDIDINETWDIFAHDRATHATTRLSITSDGGASTAPTVSAEGQVVAFESNATTLVMSDTNGVSDIFVHDRVAGMTERVSIGIGGLESNGSATSAAFSADGRYVAFAATATNLVISDTNGVADIFVYDRITRITERISLDSDASEANAPSLAPSISADGTWVAFESSATNLVAGDTNGRSDIFVHNRTTGETRRVSVSSDSIEGNAGAIDAAISMDGNAVVFMSLASNLVVSDTNSVQDIFRHTLTDGQTIRLSVSTYGAEGTEASRHPAVNGDGTVTVFDSAAVELVKGNSGNATDVFRHTRSNTPPPTFTPTPSATPRIPPYPNEQFIPTVGLTRRFKSPLVRAITLNGDGDSYPVQVLAEGAVVLFASNATNLVPEDTNEQTDLFVWRRDGNQIERLSVGSNGSEANGASWRGTFTPDGQWLLFSSVASNLVPNDMNMAEDLFLKNMETGEMMRLPADSIGAEVYGNSHSPAMSADARWVAFSSNASNLADSDLRGITHAYLLDRTTGIVRRVSQWGEHWADNTSIVMGISADGRYVLYESLATNLVANDTNGQADIFIYDRQFSYNWRVNVSATGEQANGYTFAAELSADGRWVSFTSSATNLVPTDTNGVDDIFVTQWSEGAIERLSVASGGSQLTHGSGGADISDSGQFVAFDSGDPTIVFGDRNNKVDTFIRDRERRFNWHGSATTAGGFPNEAAGNFPRISPDGEWVIFASRATNLVEGKSSDTTDLFLARP